MRVILLEDIRGLGKKFDIKEVNDGYARNLLIPKGVVKIATPDAVKDLNVLKGKFAEEETKLKKHLEGVAKTLGKKAIMFEVKANEAGNVFGSVTKAMILKALHEHYFVTKDRVEIHLDHPLKELGAHIVPIDFKKGIRAKVKVILQPQT